MSVTAAVSGVSPAGNATATLALSPTPSGDATRGAAVFGGAGADCAFCHGETGHGSGPPDGGMWTIAGAQYPFPAPGLNAEEGNLAGNAAWTPELLAFAARSDVGNGGLTLRSPMPNWIKETYKDGGSVTTQDLADVHAFLKTQTK